MYPYVPIVVVSLVRLTFLSFTCTGLVFYFLKILKMMRSVLSPSDATSQSTCHRTSCCVSDRQQRLQILSRLLQGNASFTTKIVNLYFLRRQRRWIQLSQAKPQTQDAHPRSASLQGRACLLGGQPEPFGGEPALGLSDLLRQASRGVIVVPYRFRSETPFFTWRNVLYSQATKCLQPVASLPALVRYSTSSPWHGSISVASAFTGWTDHSCQRWRNSYGLSILFAIPFACSKTICVQHYFIFMTSGRYSSIFPHLSPYFIIVSSAVISLGKIK